MLPLIMLDACVYSFILFARKNYFLKKITTEMYMLSSSIISIVLLFIYFAYKPDDLFSKKNINGLKEIFIPLVVISIVGSLNWYLYLYLIKNTELSTLIPLNELFIILSSCLLGVIILGEKLKPINIAGIIGGLVSIYFINL